MGYEQVLYDVGERIATITMNRPDKLNAFTGTMGEEIYDAYHRALDDDDVGAIILTGAGRGFCAGVDLSVLGTEDEAQKISGGNFIRKFPAENYACPKPTLCAMNGAAIGVGVTMALSFDVRIAATDAKLGVPFVKLGILPGFGASMLLPKLVGRGKALELLLSARTILGEEAAEIGLVNRAVPADQVLSATRELAAQMAALDPVGLEFCKRSITRSQDASLDVALANEGAIMQELREARAAAGG